MSMYEPDRIAALAVELFERAGADEDLGERLAFAGTIVRVTFTDETSDHSASCTIYLDREPVGAELGSVCPAEVEITGSVQQWKRIIRGDDWIQMAILHGGLTYTGPVRKFLRVTPMLSRCSYTAFREDVASAVA